MQEVAGCGVRETSWKQEGRSSAIKDVLALALDVVAMYKRCSASAHVAQSNVAASCEVHAGDTDEFT